MPTINLLGGKIQISVMPQTSCILIAWCELRQGFRHFRADRIIIEAKTLEEKNGLRQGELRRRWQLWPEANVRVN